MGTMGPYRYTGPAVKFYMDYTVSQSESGNYSTIKLTVRGYNDSTATTGSSYSGSGIHRGTVDGADTNVVTYSADPFLPSGFAANEKRWEKTGTSNQIHHSSDGTHGDVRVRMLIDYGGVNDEFTVMVPLPTIAQVPNKINTVNTSDPDIDSFVVSYGTPNGNGAAVTGFDVQWDQASNFSSPSIKTDNASPTSILDLGDAARYYVRVRAKNSVGNAPWSTDGANEVTLPKPPGGVLLSAPTTVQMHVRWDSPGPVISGYEVDYSTSPTFASGVTTVSLGNVLSTDLTGLTPGTVYYVRVRAKNESGKSGNSDTANQTTLPAVPPGFQVLSSASGSAANLSFSPPGGVSGVTRYDWERRLTGTTTPVDAGSTTSPSTSVSGLTPGASYDWRASAWIGTYQSPWTTWAPTKQNKPNTQPGDYFDGESEDTADANYQWGLDGLGTPHASISTALASGVAGWELTGATGVLFRITSGVIGAFAARAEFFTDTVAAGARVGQQMISPYRSDAVAGQAYVGSIHVSPSRSQNLAAEITWLNDVGAVISRTLGAPTLIPGGSWLRLVASAIAPVGTKFAAVHAIDVAGTGWSLWRGGQYLDADAAMISLDELFPYFDGGTLPDGTYVYEWTDPTKPNASPSKRTARALLDAGAPAADPADNLSAYALIDPGCLPVPAPPRPPEIVNVCIPGSSTWKRHYYNIPGELVSDWLDIVPTLYVTNTAEKPAREARIRYYPNPDNLPANMVDTSSWIAEQIISFMPAHTRFALDGVTQRVWAAVNGAKAVHADHLLYGTGGKPPQWPVLSCGIPYLVSVETPLSDGTTVDITASLTARV